MRKITTAIYTSFLGVFLVAGTALALPFTEILDDGPEVSLIGIDGILDEAYGLSHLTRIDDDFDQIWNTAPGIAQLDLVAKHAGYNQNFGYIPQNSSSGFGATGFVSLLTEPGGPTSNAMPTEGKFVWALDPSGAPLWTSLQSNNTADNSFDHMVTWRITGGAGNTVGNYVLAWEDLPGGGDQDYNDLVVEVGGAAPVPEPATMLLFGTGLIGLAGARFRRKKK